MTQSFETIGKPRKLIEGLEKVTGRATYAGDVTLPGMLYARPVLSPYAHATIMSIDSSAAMQVPGVVAVLRADDLPTRDRAMNSRHSAVLARERVLWRGQPVVVVLAENEAAARDGADAVLIDYQPLEVVSDPVAAQDPASLVLWPDGLPKDGVDMTAAHAAVDKSSMAEVDHHANPNRHDSTHYSRGDVVAGFAEAEVVIERSYRTPAVHQSYLEPCAAVAEPDPFRGSITLYVSTQGQFTVRDEVARLLGLTKSKVRVVPMTVGGGFGAKYGIIESLVAASAWVMKRPVRMVLTRSEEFLNGTPSPASQVTMKIGARKDGFLTAIQATAVMDNGVFPFTVGGIMGILIGGYYKCANVKIDVNEVLTNKPQMGAYRAPGAPQATFALESTIDEMAYALGLDPLEFRLQNAVETGDLMGNNDHWPSLGLRLVLEQMRQHPAWQQRQTAAYEGVGIAVGGWPCGMSPAASVCRVDTDGTVRIHVGSVDISGVNSTFALVAAEILGVSPDQVEIIQGDTQSGPYAGPSGGSQTTYSVSGAVAQAAEAAKRRLLEIAANEMEAAPEDLEIVNGQVGVKGVPAAKKLDIGQLANLAENQRGGPGPVIGEGRSAVEQNAPGFVVHLARVAVDPDTGEIALKQYVAVQDVGRALNPMMVEGQIHGGSVQGIGYGLHEAMVYDEHGQLLSGTFMDYSLPTADRLPPIETVLVENPAPHGPFGARGIGEPPITAGAAAVANAVRAAVGVRMTETPIRAEAVWQALQSR